MTNLDVSVVNQLYLQQYFVIWYNLYWSSMSKLKLVSQKLIWYSRIQLQFNHYSTTLLYQARRKTPGLLVEDCSLQFRKALIFLCVSLYSNVLCPIILSKMNLYPLNAILESLQNIHLVVLSPLHLLRKDQSISLDLGISENQESQI